MNKMREPLFKASKEHDHSITSYNIEPQGDERCNNTIVLQKLFQLLLILDEIFVSFST